jgi:Tfp pilus assembly protein PilV
MRGRRADRDWVRRVTDQMESEQGSILIEVLVSAILLTITAVGVFNAFDAGARSTAEERHRSQAEGLGQADLARLRTMRISALSNLEQTKVVTIDGTPYTVKSDAEFQTDNTGTASCETGKASADYIQIRSSVSWPSIGERAPVVTQSLVAPPNGSISAESGSLAIQIVDADNVGIEGIPLAGSGAGTFSGATGSNGCVIFGNLKKGNYTLGITAPLLVDPKGKAPVSQPTSVVAEGTNTLGLQYDEPGEIVAEFETWVGGNLVPTKADAIAAYHSGQGLTPRIFGTPGTAMMPVTAKPMFPFSSAYAVYAGTCSGNDPNSSSNNPLAKPLPDGVIAEALVPPAGKASVKIELPPLNLTVKSGTSSGNPGSPVQGATVKVSDILCTAATPLVRTYTTNSVGGLNEPGLPYSSYKICVTNGSRRYKPSTTFKVPTNPESAQAGTTLSTIYLGAGESTSSPC